MKQRLNGQLKEFAPNPPHPWDAFGGGWEPPRVAEHVQRSDGFRPHADAYALFDEMEDKDAHLFSLLQTRKLGVVARPRNVEAAGSSGPDLEAAGWLERTLEGIEGWPAALTHLMDGLARGMAVLEIIWGFDAQGRIVPAALKPRAAGRFVWDARLWQWRLRETTPGATPPAGDPKGRLLPPRKFIVAVHGGSPERPYGKGLLERVYWHWWFKKHNIRFWLLYNEMKVNRSEQGFTLYKWLEYSLFQSHGLCRKHTMKFRANQLGVKSMAPKQSSQDHYELPKPKLTVPRNEAAEKINERIKVLDEMQGTNYQGEMGLGLLRAAKTKAFEYDFELLRAIFTNESEARKYELIPELVEFATDYGLRISASKDTVHRKKTFLEGLVARLDFFEVNTSTPSTSEVSPKKPSNRIFIVHGRDDSIKNDVARFLERVGLKPIILHEQPNKGRTIIEKFTDHSDVGFAVVLCSPDDEGRLKGKESNLIARPRQNVILELGFFLGKLGKAKVAAITREANLMELPSDYNGVLFTPYEGNWQQELVRELKAAGYEIDANKMYE